MIRVSFLVPVRISVRFRGRGIVRVWVRVDRLELGLCLGLWFV